MCLSVDTHIIIGNGHWAPATAAAHKHDRAKLETGGYNLLMRVVVMEKNSGKISGPKTAKLMQSSALAAAATAVASVFQQSVIS